MEILSCKDLNYIYGAGTPFVTQALKNVSFDVQAGEIIGIIGHTGSGKSTLIEHLNGLLKPESGTVYLKDEDIWADKSKIKSVRFSVGLCFQYPEYQIFENDVFSEIAFGPKKMGLDAPQIKERVLESMDFLGLDRALADKSPFDLSGGLDPRGRDQVLQLIRDYQQKTGRTVLVVSHSMEDVAKLASRVLVMYGGEVAMYGTVAEVYAQVDKLRAMGLNVPEVTAVFAKLHAMGVPCRTDIYTLESAAAEVRRLMKGEKTHDQ